MSTAELPTFQTSKSVNIHEWDTFAPSGIYECRAVVFRDGEGYSAFALQLPGVASQGMSTDEAIENLTEAFRGAIESYLAAGSGIPWRDYDSGDPLKHIGLDEIPKDFRARWILVNV